MRRSSASVLVALLAACSGQDSDDAPSLVTTATEPAGENCAAGGTAIHTGLDEDGDGTLGDAEVTATEYACNEEGAGDLVEVVDEPPGGHCPEGGVAVHSGFDGDGDGTLGDDEVETTTYVCGAPGALDGIVFGDVGIASPEDAALLVGIEQITGDLVIDAPDLTSLDLSSLREVGGLLDLQRSNLTTLAAPILERVEGLQVYDGSAEGGIVSLSFPALRVVDSSIFVSEPVLESVDLSALERLGSPGLQGNVYLFAPAIEEISFPSLWLVTDEWSIGWPSLETLSAPALRRVGTMFVANTESVVTVEFPSLESVATLVIGSNLTLAELLFPALVDVDSLTVQNNPVLPTCQAMALAAQSGAGSVTITGNDDGGTCD